MDFPHHLVFRSAKGLFRFGGAACELSKFQGIFTELGGQKTRQGARTRGVEGIGVEGMWDLVWLHHQGRSVLVEDIARLTRPYFSTRLATMSHCPPSPTIDLDANG